MKSKKLIPAMAALSIALLLGATTGLNGVVAQSNGQTTTPMPMHTATPPTDKEQTVPEIRGVASWINSEPITFEQLRGNVVLVHFWTYTDVQSKRTLPYLKVWHEKYADMGLTIVGIHTPEFDFQKDRNNVVEASERLGLEYPIAQDNDYKTWRAFNNRYWPAKYLVDKTGLIRHTHFGEGAYEDTEMWIRSLLEEAGANPNSISEHFAGGTSMSVTMQDIGGSGKYAFSPSEMSFNVGERVTFTLTSETEFHTFEVDDLDIYVEVNTGETVTYEFTFDKAGVYELVCTPHKAQGKTGTIIVTSSQSSTLTLTPTCIPTQTPIPINTPAPPATLTLTATPTETPTPTDTPIPTETPTNTPAPTSTSIPTETPMPPTQTSVIVVATATATPLPPTQTPVIVVVTATPSADTPSSGGCNSVGTAPVGTAAANMLFALAPLAIIGGIKYRRKVQKK